MVLILVWSFFISFIDPSPSPDPNEKFPMSCGDDSLEKCLLRLCFARCMSIQQADATCRELTADLATFHGSERLQIFEAFDSASQRILLVINLAAATMRSKRVDSGTLPWASATYKAQPRLSQSSSSPFSSSVKADVYAPEKQYQVDGVMRSA